MTAAVIIILIAFGVAATALLGRPRAITGLAGQSVVVLPLVAISAAYPLSQGMGLAWSLVAGLAVFIGCVAASFVPRPDPASADGADGRGSLTWICGVAIALGLAGLLVSWLASLIEFATPLNRSVVVVLICVAGVLVALGPGIVRVWSRVFLAVAVAGAILLILAGFAVGAPASLASPQINVGSPNLLAALVFAVAVVIVGATHPGIQTAARFDRRGLLSAALVMALVTVGVLVGLLMVCAGTIKAPSYSMFTLLAFMPPVVLAVVAGSFALGAILGVGRTLRDVDLTSVAIRDRFTQTPRRPWQHPVRLLIGGAVVAIVAIVPAPQVEIAIVLAVFGLVRLIAGNRGSPQTTYPGVQQADEVPA